MAVAVDLNRSSGPIDLGRGGGAVEVDRLAGDIGAVQGPTADYLANPGGYVETNDAT